MDDKFPSQRLDSSSDDIVSALFLLDAGHSCIFLNEAAQQLAGFSIEELKDKTLPFLISSGGDEFSADENGSIINALKSNKKTVGQDILCHKDGGLFPVSYRISPFPIPDNKISTVLEITKLPLAIKANEDLPGSEQQLLMALEGAELGTYEFYPQTGEVNWSVKTKQFFGLSAEDDVDYNIFLERLHPEDRERANDAVQKAMLPENGGLYENEYRTIGKKDGEIRWVRSKGKVNFDEAGKPIRFVGIIQDITEEKIAGEKHAYRTALLEAQNEAIPDAILTVDAKGNMLSFNQHFSELWNIPQDILNRKDDAAALQFAMTQLVDPQGFIDRVNYCYAHPNEKAHEEVLFKDGRIIERYGNAVNGEDGTNYGWAWYFKDITERKKIEQDLKNAKEQLELTFKNIPAGVYLINQKGELIYVNDKGAKVYGDFTPEDLLAEKDLSALFKKAEELFERYDEDGKPFGAHNSPAYISLTTGKSCEATLNQVNRITREEQWHFVQGAPLFDEAGKVSMVLVTSTDITHQKNAEKKIRESEEQFRTLANSIPQLSWMANADGFIYWYNEKWYEYTGTTLEDMEGWGWQSVHDPEELPKVLERWRGSIETGSPFEMVFPLKGADGIFRPFLTRVLPVLDINGKIYQWFGTNTDITAQVETEKALKKAKDQLELTFKNVPSAIFHFDKTGKIIYLNEKGANLLGYATVEEVLGEQDILKLRKQADETYLVLDDKGNPLPTDLGSAALCFKTGKPSEVVSQSIHRKTGAASWLLSRSSPLFDEKGELVIVLTTSTDVTAQKTSEQAIRQSEEKFRTLAETLPQLVWMRNSDGSIEYASKSWEEYSGIKGISEAWENMTHPDDLGPIMSVWQKAQETGTPFTYEVRLKNKEGEYRWHYAVGELVKDDAGNVVKWIGALTDIHIQKTFAEKLEKLVAERTKELERSNEDLQQFAHVASHDLKEPVRKIMMFGNMLKDELNEEFSEKAKIYISKIEHASRRMYSMIDGVLMYASAGADEQSVERVDLSETISHVETDLEIAMQEKKAVIYKENLPVILGSPVLLHQLFYNLINNSLKFSKADENPVIRIISEKIRKSGIDKKGVSGGEYIQIKLKDNGIGFEQGQAEKIFKTFSRLHSKDKFEGTGLGLSLCKKIVERHGGSIIAEGKQGEGAMFIITLPQLTD